MWNPNISIRRDNLVYSGSTPWFHKRKIDMEPGEFDVPPQKMLITEEKMVNQLREIHLSQEYTTHGAAGPSNAEVDMDDHLSGIRGEKSSALPTLVICDEIRELRGAMDSSLPKQLLENYKRPSTALVLWRPPAGELGSYLKSIRDSSKENEESPPSDIDMDDDNNNHSVSETNSPFTRTV